VLGRDKTAEKTCAGNISAWPVEACDDTSLDRVLVPAIAKFRLLGGARCRMRSDHIRER
jgi:hypothetical protein